MGIYDLKTIVFTEDDTANFHIKLLLREGVGYEVVWSWSDNFSKVHHLPMTRKFSEAQHQYEQQLRKLCVIEAQMALGLPIDDTTTMKGE